MDWVDICRVELQNAAGAWVGITPYVRFQRLDSKAFRGRQNETDAIGAGSMQLGLDNSSGIFTPGVTSATLAITLGMPVRAFDVIGYRKFPIFTGTLEMPDSAEALEGVDNLISVTAVDRKQLLDNGRTFVSNLAEYIRYTHVTSLVGYWPMSDAAAPAGSLISGVGPLAQETAYFGQVSFPTSPLLQYASISGPAGDDARYPQWTVGGDNSTSLVRARLANRTLTMSLSPTYVAVSLWVLIGLENTGTQTLVIRDNAFVQSIVLSYSLIGNFWQWQAAVTTGAGTTTVTGGTVNVASWQYLTVRVNTATNAIDFWVDQTAATGSYTGTLSGTFGSVLVDGMTSASSAGHLQLHAFSTSSTYDQTSHLAQYFAGVAGINYQRTDQRIRTILNYAAGSGAAIPAVLDEGSTYMQRASLAGKRPGQVIDEAVATERGRFFIDGSGESTFHARVRAYNL